jgi:hypothetical protein
MAQSTRASSPCSAALPRSLRAARFVAAAAAAVIRSLEPAARPSAVVHSSSPYGCEATDAASVLAAASAAHQMLDERNGVHLHSLAGAIRKAKGSISADAEKKLVRLSKAADALRHITQAGLLEVLSSLRSLEPWATSATSATLSSCAAPPSQAASSPPPAAPSHEGMASSVVVFSGSVGDCAAFVFKLGLAVPPSTAAPSMSSSAPGSAPYYSGGRGPPVPPSAPEAALCSSPALGPLVAAKYPAATAAASSSGSSRSIAGWSSIIKQLLVGLQVPRTCLRGHRLLASPLGLKDTSCDLCAEECASHVRCGLCGFDICYDCYDFGAGSSAKAEDEPT